MFIVVLVLLKRLFTFEDHNRPIMNFIQTKYEMSLLFLKYLASKSQFFLYLSLMKNFIFAKIKKFISK